MGGTNRRCEGRRIAKPGPSFPGPFHARLSRAGSVLTKSLSLYQELSPSLAFSLGSGDVSSLNSFRADDSKNSSMSPPLAGVLNPAPIVVNSTRVKCSQLSYLSEPSVSCQDMSLERWPIQFPSPRWPGLPFLLSPSASLSRWACLSLYSSLPYYLRSFSAPIHCPDSLLLFLKHHAMSINYTPHTM